jgi:ABC-type multidrug transport system fused ATPase/permease subunit
MTKDGSHLNWFQRHPNTVMFLTWLVLSLLVGSLFGIMRNSTMEWDTQNQILAVCCIIIIIVCFVVTGWGLRQKGWSLWWMLLLPVPLGPTIILFLNNWRIGILTEKQMQSGLYLEKEGNLFILKRGDEVLTNFYSKTTAIPFIREEAQKYV